MMEKDETPKGEPEKLKRGLTREQRQRLKKMMVYPMLFLLFAGAMWIIFTPSAKDKDKQMQEKGFNTVIPQPKKEGIIGDKQTAYEHDQVEEKQKERSRTMQDLASLFGSSKESLSKNDSQDESGADLKNSSGTGNKTGSRPHAAIYSSASAYKDINRTLGSFYESPKKDSEKEELKQKVEQLSSRLDQSQTPKSNFDEQVALMEKSYELAARYIPQSAGSKGIQSENKTTKASVTSKEDKAKVVSVSKVTCHVVSALNQPMDNTGKVLANAPVNRVSFHTAVGIETSPLKNTIKACIYENQTITDGHTVRMRLLEPMAVGKMVIPQNNLIIGMAKIQGERLSIKISSLEYNETIIPVDLSVFDTDGQEGIFIPGSMEMNAVKEVAANMGSSLGTSISITQSAGQQVAADLSKGLMQGTSQYISKKMQAVRVHLKAGYIIMLFAKQD